MERQANLTDAMRRTLYIHGPLAAADLAYSVDKPIGNVLVLLRLRDCFRQVSDGRWDVATRDEVAKIT